jgi:hypothetical protein
MFFFHDGTLRLSWWHTTIRSTNAEERLIKLNSGCALDAPSVICVPKHISRVLPPSRHYPDDPAFIVARSRFSAGANGMLERSLHFPIKPGVVAAWNTRAVVIVALLDGSSTRVRDVATGEGLDVPVEELQGIPAIGQLESNEGRWALVRNSTRAEWKQARRRERVLRRCNLRDGDSSEGIEFACKALDLSRRTIYRCSPIIVLPHKRPP